MILHEKPTFGYIQVAIFNGDSIVGVYENGDSETHFRTGNYAIPLYFRIAGIHNVYLKGKGILVHLPDDPDIRDFGRDIEFGHHGRYELVPHENAERVQQQQVILHDVTF